MQLTMYRLKALSSKSQGEVLLNEDGWKEEAMGVIKEIKDYVKQLTISELVSSSSSAIYLNLTTLEGDKYTVRLSERGFSIVACELDSVLLEG